MSRFLIIAAAAASLVASAVAEAGATDGRLAVSLTIVPACRIEMRLGGVAAEADSAGVSCGSTAQPNLRVRVNEESVYEGGSLGDALNAAKRVQPFDGQPTWLVVEF